MTPEPSAAEQQAADRAARAAEARTRREKAAEAERAKSLAVDLVRVRITRFGDGQVSSGEHAPGLGDLCYEAGDTPEVPREVAEALEACGFAEIEAR
ncbi:MAG TPA: hypothetical protein VG939_05790 [Caulobacteraceae bacterium]|nr:hypothetical protein [Caulobacteraceae bacterium]